VDETVRPDAPSDPFDPVLRAAALFVGFPRPWYVAGGWALDLFLGRVTRDHEDVEVAILRSDQGGLRAHLAGWSFEKVIPDSPSGREPWPPSERLEPPVHEIHAHRDAGTPDEMEILLNESDGRRWRFRRDMRVTLPLQRMGRIALGGVPVLAPEIVLLYKAKGPRARDEHDFRETAPALDAEARRWLRRALTVCHPGHPWLPALPA
jgi:hypothetical protein